MESIVSLMKNEIDCFIIEEMQLGRVKTVGEKPWLFATIKQRVSKKKNHPYFKSRENSRQILFQLIILVLVPYVCVLQGYLLKKRLCLKI